MMLLLQIVLAFVIVIGFFGLIAEGDTKLGEHLRAVVIAAIWAEVIVLALKLWEVYK